MTTAILIAVCVAWFFGTMLFYRRDDQEYVQGVERFFDDMRTPIDSAVEHDSEYASDSKQYGMLGSQCLVYGIAIYVLLLIPNSAAARVAIASCGSLLAGTGGALRLIGHRLARPQRRASAPLLPVR